MIYNCIMQKFGLSDYIPPNYFYQTTINIACQVLSSFSTAIRYLFNTGTSIDIIFFINTQHYEHTVDKLYKYH